MASQSIPPGRSFVKPIGARQECAYLSVMRRWFGWFFAMVLLAAAPLGAQSLSGGALSGLWQLEKGKVEADGPRTVMIRTDSSASWGKETVRWRLRPAESEIMIALGGEWETYTIRLRGNRLELSGGDLTEKITLKKVGPATPRPAHVPLPPDPDSIPDR